MHRLAIFIIGLLLLMAFIKPAKFVFETFYACLEKIDATHHIPGAVMFLVHYAPYYGPIIAFIILLAILTEKINIQHRPRQEDIEE